MKSSIFTALFGFATNALAQNIAQQTFDGVTYRINIPASTPSNNPGEIFLQVTAPTSYAWVALGQGTGMAGSNIFVIYTSSSGNNVTVSPRLASGYVMPRFNSEAQIEVLEGSGVENGMMTANFKCSNCNSWNGGEMDFSQNSASWIHAANRGSSINSDDTSFAISRHNANNEAPFTWDMSSGRGGNSVNPFVEFTPPAAGQDSGVVMGPPFSNAMLIGHGGLASLAMVIFFPIGAISIRVLNFPGLVWFHAATQAIGLALFTAAVGLGIYIAKQLNYLDEYHPIIGLVVFALMFFQPIGGLLHHLGFKKSGQRNIWSYGHIWLGRALITLGMINGGLGLLLADNSRSGNIAYGVIAGLVWVAWVAASLFGEMKRSKTPVKYDQSSRKDGASS